MSEENLIKITDMEYRMITDFLKSNYGIDMGEEKKSLLVSRLGCLLKEKGFLSFSEFYKYVINDLSGDALVLLIDRLTTNHTYFMREVEHFDYFKNIVLPMIIKDNKEKDLRIWSAGCSTGEEPYTLSMIINDFFLTGKLFWNTKVLATDISTNALNKAIKGVYTLAEIEMLPKMWQNKFFEKVDDEKFKINGEIKNEVIFRRFNLMENVFPFKNKFHVIFCRNVMIYFNNQTKTELINKFYDITEPGGYLFIGHSESIGRDNSKYKYVLPAIYRKQVI